MQGTLYVLDGFLQVPSLILEQISLSKLSFQFSGYFIAPESSICDTFAQATTWFTLTSHCFFFCLSDNIKIELMWKYDVNWIFCHLYFGISTLNDILLTLSFEYYYSCVKRFLFSFFSHCITNKGTLPWCRQLVAGFSQQSPRFNPSPVHVGFVVARVALGQRFSPVHWCSPAPCLFTDLSAVLCNSS